MKRFTTLMMLGLFAAIIGFSVCPVAAAQASGDEDSQRKIVKRETPVYPDIARRMKISGVVKAEAVVGNNGLVQSIDIKGGHPILAQAVIESVHRWKWEPASHPTKEHLVIKFEQPE